MPVPYRIDNLETIYAVAEHVSYVPYRIDNLEMLLTISV